MNGSDIAYYASRGPGAPFFATSGGPSDEALENRLAGLKILLVEDEVFIAFDLKHALEDAGAEVAYARTLKQAIKIVEGMRFDGAVLDVTLGANDTCQPIADRLRELGTPFLLHSGDLDRQGEVIAGLAAPVVRKPSAPEDVVRELAAMLDAESDGTKH